MHLGMPLRGCECRCVCFLWMWFISLCYWWARSVPFSPWPSSCALTPPVHIMPAANTCCQRSEKGEKEGEIETEMKSGLYVLVPCVNLITHGQENVFSLLDHRAQSDFWHIMSGTCFWHLHSTIKRSRVVQHAIFIVLFYHLLAAEILCINWLFVFSVCLYRAASWAVPHFQ